MQQSIEYGNLKTESHAPWAPKLHPETRDPSWFCKDQNRSQFYICFFPIYTIHQHQHDAIQVIYRYITLFRVCIAIRQGTQRNESSIEGKVNVNANWVLSTFHFILSMMVFPIVLLWFECFCPDATARTSYPWPRTQVETVLASVVFDENFGFEWFEILK